MKKLKNKEYSLMKKISKLTLLLLLPLTLTGCSLFGGNENNEDSSQQVTQSSPTDVTTSKQTSSNEQKTSSINNSSSERQTSSSVSSSENKSSSVSGSSNVKQSSSVEQSSSQASSSANQQSSSGPKYNIPEGFTPYKANVPVELAASLSEVNSKYDLEFAYDDSYFYGNPAAYDQDLALLSFGASVVTGDAATVKSFYEAAGFGNVKSYGYDTEPTKDSIGVNFAYKMLPGNRPLIAVSFRGFNYGMEWSNNFKIGSEQMLHQGFEDSLHLADGYYSSYVQEKNLLNKEQGEPIFWVTGYSRGGAIANLFAGGFNDSVTVFGYTFEAPATATPEIIEVLNYHNVHNIRNSSDIVTCVPPEVYDLHRIGTDYDLAVQNYEDYVSMFDETIVIPESRPVAIDGVACETDASIVKAIVDYAFREEDGSDKTAGNRQDYVDRYQNGFCNVVGLMFAMSTSTRNEMITALNDLDFLGKMNVIYYGSYLANFLKPFFDQDGLTYDEGTLEDDCQAVCNALTSLLNPVLMIYMDSSKSPALTRILNLHYPEVTYALLKYAPHNF